jgi:hypothetical protein
LSNFSDLSLFQAPGMRVARKGEKIV